MAVVLRRSNILKIGQTAVRFIAILVVYLVSSGRWTHECSCDQYMSRSIDLTTVSENYGDARIAAADRCANHGTHVSASTYRVALGYANLPLIRYLVAAVGSSDLTPFVWGHG